MMKILVTGGAGFIGSALVAMLVELGHDVTVLDNLSRSGIEPSASKHVIIGSVCDAATVTRAVDGMDAVVHLAAVNGTANFYKHPARTLEVAVRGTLNVISALNDSQTFLLASSSEAYQNAATVPTPEDVPLVVPDLRNPRYSYGGGKIASELLAFHVASQRAARVCIVRPHNVYGPSMGWDHVIPNFIERLNALPVGDKDFEIQGTGEETRAFCYISDMVDGMVAVLEKGANLGVYNIGTQDEITVAGLARAVGHLMGRAELKIRPGPRTEGSPLRRCPDVAKLTALGWEPKVPLLTGLETTIDWYVKHARR